MKKISIAAVLFVLAVFVCGAIAAEQSPLEQEVMVAEPSNAPPPSPPAVTDPDTGMEFVLVKGGCFCMGDTFGDGRPDSKPVHAVCVDDFYLGKYEVTQAQWQKIMGNNPCSSALSGSNRPAVEVSWHDVQEFIRTMNRNSGKNYRLPTEAEWEYAARGGDTGDLCSGSGKEARSVSETGSGGDVARTLRPVGLSTPNSLGIYDMIGSVWEWTTDWYGRNYYSESSAINPAGPSDGRCRTLRGGSWIDNQKVMRPFFRVRYEPSVQRPWIGFRMALPAENGIKRYDKPTLEKLSCSCTEL